MWQASFVAQEGSLITLVIVEWSWRGETDKQAERHRVREKSRKYDATQVLAHKMILQIVLTQSTLQIKHSQLSRGGHPSYMK